MIARCVLGCARHPWLVLVVALLVAAGGELARRGLADDVVPNLSDPQIGVVADWMGHGAPEVAAKVTSVLTDALHDLPGVTAVRGSTMSGMAYVDVVLDGKAGLDAVHRAVRERAETARAKLPSDVRVQVGPPASSTGWVFAYALVAPAHVSSLHKMRRFQDEVLRPALLAIPGVAEVATVGGGVQQARIDLKPNEMRERGVAFTDLVAALKPAFAAGGGMANPEELGGITVRADEDGPIHVRDVARLHLTDDMPTGLADVGGSRAVAGIVIARPDANVGQLVRDVQRTLDRERVHLPRRPSDPGMIDPGVSTEIQLVTVYDRSDLASRVHHTLLAALGEEVAVVVVIILVFLLHWRSALVPLVTLPMVLLLTFAGMWIAGVPAAIMSLGGIGIALGIAVDAEVVALEASHRRLETLVAPSREARRFAIVAAVQRFAPAILTSLMITSLSFLPVFTFTGETGRLLYPLALTKTLVVASAAVVTLTVAPALRELLLRGKVRPEFENPLTRGLVRLYRPFVRFALARPAFTLVTAALAVLSCIPLLPKLGGEFLPRIDEGDLLYMPTAQPGVPPAQAAVHLSWQDRALREVPEVETVFGKVGRADTGTDPAPYAMAETIVRLRPRSEWPTLERTRWYSTWAPEPVRRLLRHVWPERTPRTYAELVEELDRAARLPGWTSAWTAPARARMDMLATGVRTPAGLRIVSPDPQRLDALGTELRSVLSHVPGTRSAVFESQGGETWLGFEPDPEALARHGVAPAALQETIDLLASGGTLGEIEHEHRRLRARIGPEAHKDDHGPADEWRTITVRSSAPPARPGEPPAAKTAGAEGQPVPLSLLGRPSYMTRPAVLRTERGELVAYVYVDLEAGIDVERYVESAQLEVNRVLERSDVRLATGERIEWTGQYTLLAAGKRRLGWIVPMVLVSMFALLWLQFRNAVEAAIVLVSVPFALVGSFWTLFLLSYPLSAPVWVGLLSTVGLAMQTGVVMVVYIDEAFHRRLREGRLKTREDIVEAHAEGTVRRLRPKIMTIATMAASLLPLLWTEGPGADVMKRVAAPMLGGLATSTALTLEVLPVIYTIWRYHQLRRTNYFKYLNLEASRATHVRA
ncbi:efflux RND transporter permease subunit [Pendulispora albinea]|uniref:Efflux RND transporter permease subunit n=1 Tax=Pendulispora albinea TaxID=2741071 RepID=A0ABZ2MBL5_9BACT